MIIHLLESFHICMCTTYILCRPVTSQFCYWTVDSCSLDCMSGTLDEVNRIVEDRWQEVTQSYIRFSSFVITPFKQTIYIYLQRPQCHSDGIKLILGSSIKYTVDWSIPARWFTANVTVVELVVDCQNTVAIADDAFSASAFSTIQKLTLQFAWSNNMMTAQSLNGLSELKMLHMLQTSMVQIRSGTLNAVAATLEELIFEESSKYDSMVLIDGLTGGNAMSRATNIKIQRNLKDSITDRTFVALVSVTRLDLSYCQIEVLPKGSFAPIANTIRELNLQNNNLEQLPAGLLDRLVTRPEFTINLDANQWMCNCDLCYLRWIINNGQFVDLSKLACKLPLQFRDQEISDVDFCPNHQLCDVYSLEDTQTTLNPWTPPPDVTDNHTVTTTPIPNSNESDEESAQLYRHQCTRASTNTSNTSSASESNNYVLLSSKSHEFKFLRSSSTTVTVLVESRICNMFLLWFDSTREIFRSPTLSESQAYGCTYLANTFNRSVNFHQVVVINTLQANVPYVFCLMERTSSTVSPLNCMPYMQVVPPLLVIKDDDVWLWVSDKTMKIAFIVAIVIGSVLVGFLVAYLLLRRQTRQLEKGSLMGYRSHASSFDATTIESSECRKHSISVMDG